MITNASWQQDARRELEAVGLSRDEAHTLARLLLDHATGQRHLALLAPDGEIDAETLARLHILLAEARRRRPLPHLTGQAFFYGLELEVTSDTLIPRPETELLVETTLALLGEVSAPRVADLGTGTGAIAIALATQRPDAHVWATDISDAAREVATRNARRHEATVHFLPGASDWLSPLAGLPPFDAIVSNPPYIATREIETLQAEVRDYEPRLALDGGADGLAPYRVFAARGQEFIKGGFFAMELGMGQWDDVRGLFEAQRWHVLEPRFDLQGIARVLVAVSGNDSA